MRGSGRDGCVSRRTEVLSVKIRGVPREPLERLCRRSSPLPSLRLEQLRERRGPGGVQQSTGSHAL